MKRFAVMTMKGGTGKTTTALSVAHGLSLSGKRTLLIDCDPQRNSAVTFGVMGDKGLDTLLMTGDVQIIQVRENLFLIDSGGRRLVEVELTLGRQQNRENRMREALRNLKGCDYVICDCPPSMNLINVNVLAYTDQIIVPVAMDYLSQVGAAQTMETLDEVRWITESKKIDYKILPTFYDARTRISKQVLDQLRKEFGDRVYETVIRINTALKEAPGTNKTIYEHAPLSRGAFDYYRLTEEIMAEDDPVDRHDEHDDLR
ncbi:MAG TPA: ParA family protein [Candidatus Krumholzibacterium sp.]|nr:ParA family protein [Candidatus Krumholzibacterium sp.]